MKYWGVSREASLGHMARRERRASPSWGCKERATRPDGPRWPRPEGCAAFWAVLCCSSVTDPLRGMLPRRALHSPKIDATRHTPVFHQAPKRGKRYAFEVDALKKENGFATAWMSLREPVPID